MKWTHLHPLDTWATIPAVCTTLLRERRARTFSLSLCFSVCLCLSFYPFIFHQEYKEAKAEEETRKKGEKEEIKVQDTKVTRLILSKRVKWKVARQGDTSTVMNVYPFYLPSLRQKHASLQRFILKYSHRERASFTLFSPFLLTSGPIDPFAWGFLLLLLLLSLPHSRFFLLPVNLLSLSRSLPPSFSPDQVEYFIFNWLSLFCLYKNSLTTWSIKKSHTEQEHESVPLLFSLLFSLVFLFCSVLLLICKAIHWPQAFFHSLKLNPLLSLSVHKGSQHKFNFVLVNLVTGFSPWYSFFCISFSVFTSRILLSHKQ